MGPRGLYRRRASHGVWRTQPPNMGKLILGTLRRETSQRRPNAVTHTPDKDYCEVV